MKTPPQLEVLPIDTHVRVGIRNDNDAIDGRIIEITIYADYTVGYVVEWWNGRERKNETMLRELFFLVGDVDLVAIGFSA